MAQPIAFKYPRRACASMLGVLASLSACSVGPDFKRPDPPAAARYTSDTVSTVAICARSDAMVMACMTACPLTERNAASSC